MSTELLPDSRMQRPTGTVRGPLGTYEPVACANCGKSRGMVASEFCTFAFFLCDGCAETHGDPAHFRREPDLAFWERVQQAELEHVGRPLESIELAKAIDESRNR
jgi:hypothetical protein